MSMRSWLDFATEEELRCAFESQLASDWVYFGSHRSSGELRWQQPLSMGFALELAVHPVGDRDSGFAFQTKAYITCARLLALESHAAFFDCLEGGSDTDNPRGILASIYLDGLVRLLRGGPIKLSVWQANVGLIDPADWRTLITKAFDVLGVVVTDIHALPKKLLEIDLLGSSGTPPPVTLFGNPFVLAAETAMLLGDGVAAEEYVRIGKDCSWQQQSGNGISGLSRIADCKARKLAAIGFKLPTQITMEIGGSSPV